MKYFKVASLLLLGMFIAGCEKKTETVTAPETIEIEKDKVIDMVNRNLIILEEKLDTVFYLKKRKRFNELVNTENPTNEYLLSYIDSFIAERINSDWHEEVNKKVISIKQEYGNSSPNKIYNQLLAAELEFTTTQIRYLIESRQLADIIISRIVPVSQEIKLEKEFFADIELSAVKTDGKQWLAWVNTYYEGDTIPIQTDTFNFSLQKSYLNYSFKPKKKGRYISKGECMIFTNHRYLGLPFETQFTVE